MTPAVMDSGIVQPYMHVEEMAPWYPLPTDAELVAAKQTREQAIAEAEAEAARRDATFRRMSSGMYLVVVDGAEHVSFSNQALIAPEMYPNIRMDNARALAITQSYVLAFFDRYLRNAPSTLLDQDPPPYPEVTVEVYRPGTPKRVLRNPR
jgi:hypothetical protein